MHGNFIKKSELKAITKFILKEIMLPDDQRDIFASILQAHEDQHYQHMNHPAFRDVKEARIHGDATINVMERLMKELIAWEISNGDEDTVRNAVAQFSLVRNELISFTGVWASQTVDVIPENRMYMIRLGEDMEQAMLNITQLHNRMLDYFSEWKNYPAVVNTGRAMSVQFEDLRNTVKEFFDYVQKVYKPK